MDMSDIRFVLGIVFFILGFVVLLSIKTPYAIDPTFLVTLVLGFFGILIAFYVFLINKQKEIIKSEKFKEKDYVKDLKTLVNRFNIALDKKDIDRDKLENILDSMSDDIAGLSSIIGISYINKNMGLGLFGYFVSLIILVMSSVVLKNMPWLDYVAVIFFLFGAYATSMIMISWFDVNTIKNLQNKGPRKAKGK